MATKVESNQLTDYWEDAATQTLPDYSGQTSTGFAQDGNPVTGQKATLPGAAWFNIMAAVRVSVILAAGKTPSNPPDPLQFLEALQSLGWMTSESDTTENRRQCCRGGSACKWCRQCKKSCIIHSCNARTSTGGGA